MTNIEKMDIARKMDLFKDLDLNDLLLISEAIKYKEFKKTELLYATGNYVNRIFFFVNGYFEKGDKKKYYSIFGLDYILEDKVLEKDIKVDKSTKTIALWIEKKHLFTILKEVPQFNVALIKELGNIV